MSEIVIELDQLTRRFGSTVALDGITLRVPRGCVLGLVGVNGSGKTTLLRHLLGLYRAQTGTVRVFGQDPVAEPVGVLSRIGYLSDDVDIPNWMSMEQLLRYTAAFYPRWDMDYARHLCRDFGLQTGQRISSMSRGMKVRAGLVSVLAYRPDLLILDEPSAGLDPLARRDILQAIIAAVGSEGRTVVFSSHLLDEVERVADRVALMDRGRLLFDGSLDDVRGRHRRLTIRFNEPRSTPPTLNGVLSWEGGGHEWTAVVCGDLERPSGAEVIETEAVGLNEVLVAHAGRKTP